MSDSKTTRLAAERRELIDRAVGGRGLLPFIIFWWPVWFVGIPMLVWGFS